MAKKVFALVMVISILGGILAGCSKGEDTSTNSTAPAATSGTGTAPATGTDTTTTK